MLLDDERFVDFELAAVGLVFDELAAAGVFLYPEIGAFDAE